MLALVAGGVLAVAAGAGRRSPVTGRVTAVISGDALQVKVKGKTTMVRVLGVSAPPAGSCFAADSAAATRTLALNQTVRLSSAGTSAYVTLPDGSDLGRRLITDGVAQIDSFGHSFSRLAAYVPVQQAAETNNKGMWGACAADLSVHLVADPNAVVVGDTIKYSATITNAGPLAALDVDLDIRAPQGNPFDAAASQTVGGSCAPHGWYATCTFDSIPANGTGTAVFRVEAKTEGAVSAAALVRISGCISAKCGNRPLHDSNVQNDRTGAFASIVPPPPPGSPPPPPKQLPVDHWIPGGNCDAHYPTACIPPAPPDFDCADLSFRGFQVLHDPTPRTPDPHSLDNNFDGIGCQFDDY
jgi:endonuclease YncB( thermonuclease family)